MKLKKPQLFPLWKRFKAHQRFALGIWLIRHCRHMRKKYSVRTCRYLRFVTAAVKQRLRALVDQGLAEVVDRASVEQKFNRLSMII